MQIMQANYLETFCHSAKAVLNTTQGGEAAIAHVHMLAVNDVENACRLYVLVSLRCVRLQITGCLKISQVICAASNSGCHRSYSSLFSVS